MNGESLHAPVATQPLFDHIDEGQFCWIYMSVSIDDSPQ